MTGCTDREADLMAMLDGELDAAHARAMEDHMAECAACRAAFEQGQSLSVALRSDGVRDSAPIGLLRRLDAIGSSAPSRPAGISVPASLRGRGLSRRGLVAGGGVASALAASLLIFVGLGSPGAALEDDLVEGQVRSLQAGHLVDVATSDRHVVKPWFNGKVDFATPVVDLADAGFPLVGGRLDVVRGRTVAALVFRRRAHVINVFLWPQASGTSDRVDHRRGYTLVRWGARGLVFWAVSDLDDRELGELRARFAAGATR